MTLTDLQRRLVNREAARASRYDADEWDFFILGLGGDGAALLRERLGTFDGLIDHHQAAS